MAKIIQLIVTSGLLDEIRAARSNIRSVSPSGFAPRYTAISLNRTS